MQIVKWKKNQQKSTLKNVMCLHMLKHCEFENNMKIYANANCKLLRYMKKETIANLYQMQNMQNMSCIKTSSQSWRMR